MKCRCAVQKYWMFCNNFFKNIPYNWTCTFNHTLCRFNVLRVVKIYKTLHYEWLEEFKCHLLWQTALVQLQLWTNNDY